MCGHLKIHVRRRKKNKNKKKERKRERERRIAFINLEFSPFGVQLDIVVFHGGKAVKPASHWGHHIQPSLLFLLSLWDRRPKKKAKKKKKRVSMDGGI